MEPDDTQVWRKWNLVVNALLIAVGLLTLVRMM